MFTQNPEFFKFLPCFSAIKDALKGIRSPEEVAILCNISPTAVKAYLEGNVEQMETELLNTKVGEFLQSYKQYTGRSLLKAFYDAKTAIENIKSGSIGEMLRVALMAFGIHIDDTRVIDVIQCLHEQNNILYLDNTCKNNIIKQLGPDGKRIVEGIESAVAIANFVQTWQK